MPGSMLVSSMLSSVMRTRLSLTHFLGRCLGSRCQVLIGENAQRQRQESQNDGNQKN
jgi:membrane protein YqaA with SNARE-associated domain